MEFVFGRIADDQQGNLWKTFLGKNSIDLVLHLRLLLAHQNAGEARQVLGVGGQLANEFIVGHEVPAGQGIDEYRTRPTNLAVGREWALMDLRIQDRKSTRLNSSHSCASSMPYTHY